MIICQQEPTVKITMMTVGPIRVAIEPPVSTGSMSSAVTARLDTLVSAGVRAQKSGVLTLYCHCCY